MTDLFKAQLKFMEMLPRLIDKAHELGYLVTPGQLKRCQDCHVGRVNSLHKKGLAIDLNLFSPDGIYLQKTEHHRALGEFWESLGGQWGGHWGDGNHYSIGYRGMK